MVHVHESRVRASRYDAAAVVAPQDEAPSRWWDTLLCANWSCAPVGAAVHRTDVLSIALGHLHAHAVDL